SARIGQAIFCAPEPARSSATRRAPSPISGACLRKILSTRKPARRWPGPAPCPDTTKEPSHMTSRRTLIIAALVLLGILLAGFAALGFCDIYQNHIIRACGPDCDRSEERRVGQGGHP